MNSQWTQFKDEEELWRLFCNSSTSSMEQSTAGDPVVYEESCSDDEDNDSTTAQFGDEDGQSCRAKHNDSAC